MEPNSDVHFHDSSSTLIRCNDIAERRKLLFTTGVRTTRTMQLKRVIGGTTVVLLALLMPSTLLGWGPEGHEIVAKLAQTRLSDGAKAGIRSLIGDASLASVA